MTGAIVGSVDSNINIGFVVALVVLVPLVVAAVWPFQREAMALRARALGGEAAPADVITDFGRRYRIRVQTVLLAAVAASFLVGAAVTSLTAGLPFLLLVLPVVAFSGWVASAIVVSQLRSVKPKR